VNPRLLRAALLVAALALVVFAAFRLFARRAPEPPLAEAPVASTAEEGEIEVPVDGTLQHLLVSVFYPAAAGDGLIAESHEIFRTTSPGDRAKQILADLIAGPLTAAALRALPPGTQLHQVYVLENGTAYLDFSADLKRGMRGGSAEELLVVYAIVNSVALNVPEIHRVGILINGAHVDTLSGHLDLRRPLPPDKTLIASAEDPLVAAIDRRP
jgi:spore germination protein GerM